MRKFASTGEAALRKKSIPLWPQRPPAITQTVDTMEELSGVGSLPLFLDGDLNAPSLRRQRESVVENSVNEGWLRTIDELNVPVCPLIYTYLYKYT